MATPKKAAATAEHDVVVLFRTGYGQDWNELHHVNRIKGKKGVDRVLTLEEAKTEAISEIRKHRAGAQGFEYRVKDMVSGAILD